MRRRFRWTLLGCRDKVLRCRSLWRFWASAARSCTTRDPRRERRSTKTVARRRQLPCTRSRTGKVSLLHLSGRLRHRHDKQTSSHEAWWARDNLHRQTPPTSYWFARKARQRCSTRQHVSPWRSFLDPTTTAGNRLTSSQPPAPPAMFPASNISADSAPRRSSNNRSGPGWNCRPTAGRDSIRESN